MSLLPTHMVDRWRQRVDQEPGEEVLYWHILLGGNAEIVALAKLAQDRLAPFADGLHFTPLERLHITTAVVGAQNGVAPTRNEVMADEARRRLAGVAPASVEVGRVFYHPEAIVLVVEPLGGLGPFRAAAQAATHAGAGHKGADAHGIWIPHLTLAYSVSSQPAEPIIGALGRRLPSVPVRVDTMHLVTQTGPERLWDWRSEAAVTCGEPSSIE